MDAQTELSILSKEYELTVKSCDEHIKIFYTIPTLVVGFTVTVLNTHNVVTMAFAVSIIWIFIAKLAEDIIKLVKYREYLEIEINKLIGKDILFLENYFLKNNGKSSLTIRWKPFVVIGIFAIAEVVLFLNNILSLNSSAGAGILVGIVALLFFSIQCKDLYSLYKKEFKIP